jgi:menaquinone-dependent protoporphyrinogen oxidase
MKALIAYASAHGSTAEVAQFLGRILQTYDVEVTVASAHDVTDVSDYDFVVIGSPIHAGMWLQDTSLFLERFAETLASKPSHLFITCIRVMDSDGLAHVLKEYVHHPTLNNLHIEEVAAFAGKLESSQINWDERWLLSSMYDGKRTGAAMLDHDYRDWQAIAAWGHKIAAGLKLKPSFG